jgi:cerevisin
MFKQDLASDMRENHFNFLQTAHSSDPFVADDGLHSGIRHVYDHIGGYSGSFTDNVLDQIRSMPEVEYVERDQIVKTMEVQRFAPWVSFASTSVLVI